MIQDRTFWSKQSTLAPPSTLARTPTLNRRMMPRLGGLVDLWMTLTYNKTIEWGFKYSIPGHKIILLLQKKKDFMPFRLVPKDVVYLIIYSILRHIIVFPHELKYPLLFSRELIQDSFYNTILSKIYPILTFSVFSAVKQPFYGRFDHI